MPKLKDAMREIGAATPDKPQSPKAMIAMLHLIGLKEQRT